MPLAWSRVQARVRSAAGRCGRPAGRRR
jgi:hypothetical protein